MIKSLDNPSFLLYSRILITVLGSKCTNPYLSTVLRDNLGDILMSCSNEGVLKLIKILNILDFSQYDKPDSLAKGSNFLERLINHIEISCRMRDDAGIERGKAFINDLKLMVDMNLTIKDKRLLIPKTTSDIIKISIILKGGFIVRCFPKILIEHINFSNSLRLLFPQFRILEDYKEKKDIITSMRRSENRKLMIYRSMSLRFLYSPIAHEITRSFKQFR